MQQALGEKRRTVVVTGFGPFAEHTTNASWVAVQELQKLGLGDEVDLCVREIPVDYQEIQDLVPALWKRHNPQLVVHVGVSSMATTVTLEQCGHNNGYLGLDIRDYCPGTHCCVQGGADCLVSTIDMHAVCNKIADAQLDVAISVSKDAGRYLCDFTYYTSLHQSQGRAVFIHVPPLGKPYTAEQLGRALQTIIGVMLGELHRPSAKMIGQMVH
uniref:pyroglutamyl-peptidase 1 n=1 Tax=Pristiophorus japonicus TaxID=55135 RepID=UPI00398EC850